MLQHTATEPALQVYLQTCMNYIYKHVFGSQEWSNG